MTESSALIDMLIKNAAALVDVMIKGTALLAAGVFFVWKTVSGFNNQNLSLSLQCSRSRQRVGEEDRDLVLSRISIEKGTTAALTLEGLEARFRWGIDPKQSKYVLLEVSRLGIAPSSGPQHRRVLWEPDLRRPHMYLSPGEKTSFEFMATVPQDAICEVDIVAFGRRRRSSFQAQWRASAIVPALQQCPRTPELAPGAVESRAGSAGSLC